MDAGFILYVAAQMSCLKGSHNFSPFPAIKFEKINDAVMQKRNDAIKHTVNTKKMNLHHYLISCFAVLL